jgi:hypothetical protein
MSIRLAISSDVGSKTVPDQLPLRAHQLIDGLNHVDGTRMVRAWSAMARDGLTDPPGKKGKFISRRH